MLVVRSSLLHVQSIGVINNDLIITILKYAQDKGYYQPHKLSDVIQNSNEICTYTYYLHESYLRWE